MFSCHFCAVQLVEGLNWSRYFAEQKAYGKAFYEKKKTRLNISPRKRERSRKHYANNREQYYANNAKRRAALNQIDPTSDKVAIAAIYLLAKTITKLTGTKYEVDHINPISKGGRHHQNNLVVLRADVNRAKHATAWPWLMWFNEDK